eukprot:TRINITY_DN14368_c1_g1_i1.p1 TRINITY_DN14368_c1_g1~~TRINITY_DN14368_c1_g1_i1.p1  ORF type:complete len:190 (-),score=15.19 TRINITY_DN14368_c1_g1_i1:660-1229(-)
MSVTSDNGWKERVTMERACLSRYSRDRRGPMSWIQESPVSARGSSDVGSDGGMFVGAVQMEKYMLSPTQSCALRPRSWTPWRHSTPIPNSRKAAYGRFDSPRKSKMHGAADQAGYAKRKASPTSRSAMDRGQAQPAFHELVPRLLPRFAGFDVRGGKARNPPLCLDHQGRISWGCKTSIGQQSSSGRST